MKDTGLNLPECFNFSIIFYHFEGSWFESPTAYSKQRLMINTEARHPLALILTFRGFEPGAFGLEVYKTVKVPMTFFEIFYRI